MKAVALGLAVASLIASSPCVLAEDGEKTAKYYQRLVERQDWRWLDSESSIFNSVSQYGLDYQIEIICPPRTSRLHTTIRVVKEGRTICSWEGGPYSVFVQKGKRLVYTAYHPSGSGCTLICIDLETGQEVWKTELKALGFVEHSAYRSSVTMQLGNDGIWVYGNESDGKYIELVDLITGQTLGQKTFPANEKNHHPYAERLRKEQSN